MNSPQLPLGLRFPAHQRFESFVVGDNGVAVAGMQRVAAEAAAPWVFLSGAHGSGKTHLLIAACQASARAQVQYLPLANLADRAEAALIALQDFDLLCVDDVQVLAGHRGAEIALFDVFNRGRSRGATIAFAGDQVPSRLALSLPDLASRLASCTQLTLKPLTETQRRDVLRERALARGVELDDTVLDFLFRRHSRDLGALLALLDHLDRESLIQQRRVTVPFLRRVMGLPNTDK